MNVASLTSVRGRVAVDELLEVAAEDRGLDAKDEGDGVHKVRLPGALLGGIEGRGEVEHAMNDTNNSHNILGEGTAA